MKRLVVDTGPILHLHEANALHLLPLIGNIFLPPTVVVELHAHAPDLWSSVLPEWAKIQPLSPVNQSLAVQWHHANLLHTGEAEALALSLEIKPDWFLTDDAAARLMAESLGVEVHGSIGVVLWLAVNHLLEKQEADK